MAQKKYASLQTLQTFLDNLKNTFSALSHKHTTADISDYTVDTELTSSSNNPVANSAVNDEINLVYETFFGITDEKADIYHTHTKEDVGLENVDNTADAEKSVNHATTADIANSVEWENVVDKPFNTYKNCTVVMASETIEESEQDQGLGESMTNRFLSAVINGEEYKVVFDGTEYYCVAYTDPIMNNYVVLGNFTIIEPITGSTDHDDTGEPFLICYSNVYGNAGLYTREADTHVIEVSHVDGVVESIYETCIPETIARVEDVPSIEGLATETFVTETTSTKLTEAKTYADSVAATAANAVKNDLLNGAGAAYDTLKELGDLIDDNKDAIDVLEEVAAGKANAIHTHAIADVTNLQTTLDGKAPSSHTHNVANITDLTATAAELNILDGVTASTAELNYLDGVTSNVQTQLDAKQPTITGAATTITSSNLTTSRALISDDSGKVAVSDITATELGYLTGATSNVQTQLNNTVQIVPQTLTDGQQLQARENIGAISGWSEMEDKPFGEVAGAGTLTWDGNTDGLTGISNGSGSYCYFMCDATPTLDDFANGASYTRLMSGTESSANLGLNTSIREIADGVLIAGNTYIIAEDGITSDSMTFPRKGTYFHWAGNDTYTTSLTIPNYTGFPVTKKINEKYLPNNLDWTLIYDSGEITQSVNSISGIDVSGYLNYVVMVNCVSDGTNSSSKVGAAIFTSESGATYRFPVWTNMFANTAMTVACMGHFKVLDGWLICPYASRIINNTNFMSSTEGGTAANLSMTGSGMLKCTSPLSTLAVSTTDQSSSYYLAAGSRVMVWGWNA